AVCVGSITLARPAARGRRRMDVTSRDLRAPRELSRACICACVSEHEPLAGDSIANVIRPSAAAVPPRRGTWACPPPPAPPRLRLLAGGCATIRVTDAPRAASEQFLLSEATRRAVDQLSADALRDRQTYVDTSYLLTAAFPTPENLFLVAELRNRLLISGVRL